MEEVAWWVSVITGIAFGSASLHQLRFDRYEGKPIYWIEEEMQAEYERSRTKSTTETVEYEMETGVEGALGQASDALGLDMSTLPQGWDAIIL